MIETFQLITLAVCCGYVSYLIGRRTINIPEIILGVHGLMGFTVRFQFLLIDIFKLHNFDNHLYYTALNDENDPLSVFLAPRPYPSVLKLEDVGCTILPSPMSACA